MAVEAIVSATTQQGAQAAQQEAQAAQQAAQQAARAAQQEAQQAARDAAQTAREAAREAARAIRDAQIEAARAGRAGQPSVVFPPFPNSGPQVPEGAIIISVAFFVMCAVIAIGFPIARAIARRMDRRSSSAGTGTDSATHARLERIEQAVDAIAVEVERISEGQRFATKIMSEMRSLPLPDAGAVGGERGADRVAVPLSRTRETR